MSIKIFEAGLEGTEYVSARLNNVLNHEAAVQIDKMFERLWDGMDNNSDSAYSRDDFERVAFSSKRKAEEFLNEMNAKGVPVVASSCKLNGQFLAEIPKSVDIDFETVKSQDIISSYQYDKYSAVDRQNNYENVNGPDVVGDATHALSNSAKNLFLKTLEDEDLQNFVRRVEQIVNALQAQHAVNRQDDVFRRELDADRNAKLGFRSDKYKTATVINGNVVVVDGKILQDSRFKEQILHQYNDRINLAGKNAKREDAHLNRLNFVNNARDVAFSNIEKTTVYNKINDSVKTAHTYVENLKSNLVHSYSPKEYHDLFKPGHLKESLRHETIRKNSHAVLDGVYRQEIVTKERESFALRKGGVLDELKNSLNTDAIAQIYSSAYLSFDLLLDKYDRGEVSQLAFSLKLESLLKTGELPEYTSKAVENALNSIDMMKRGAPVTFDKIVDELKNAARDNNLYSLKKDLGLDFKYAGVERKDILKINQEFIKKAEAAGIQLVNKHGKLDLKALQLIPLKASANAPSLEALGISERTRDIVVALNAKDAWGSIDIKTDSLKNLGSAVVNRFIDVVDDEDLTNIVNNLQKAVGYTRQIATSVKQFHNSVLSTVDIYKARKTGGSGLAPKSQKVTSNSKTKTKKIVEKKSDLTKVDTNANKKFLDKQSKKLNKLEKSEKKIGAKIRKKFGKVNAAYNKLKELILKLSLKIILIFFLFILILLGVIIIIGLVISLIQSFKNFDPLAAKTYKDTVAYKLYESLQEKEKEWCNSLDQFGDLYEFRNELKYGVGQKSYNDYVGLFSNLEIRDGELYVNPFGIASSGKKEVMTKLDSYNGVKKVEYSSNVSVYGLKSSGNSVSYVSTESGHTSNLKDIISMLDVMYQMDIDGFDDDSLESILQQTPAQLKWDEIKNKVTGFFKMIGNNISELWDKIWKDKEPEYVTMSDTTGNTVQYKALQKYVIELFMMSHQQQVSWTVDFYDVSNISIKVGDESRVLTLQEDDSCELGICEDPVTKKIPLGLNAGNRVVPVLESGGVKYDLTDHNNDQSVYLSEYTGADSCLWTDMGSNAETLNKIIQHMDNSANPDCWNKTTSSNEGTKKTISQTGDYRLSEIEAEADARWRLDEARGGYEPDVTKNYWWYTDSKFDCSYEKMYDDSDYENSISSSFEYATDEEWRPYYWESEDENGNGAGGLMCEDQGHGRAYAYFTLSPDFNFYFYNSDPGALNDKGYSVYRNGNTYTCFYRDYMGYDYLLHYLFGIGVASLEYSNTPLDCAENVCELELGYMHTIEKWRCTLSAVIAEKYTDSYSRVCKGHDFTYCGGHLGVHSQGIVYSITNEQSAKAGMYASNNQIPVVDDFDFEYYGYGELIGKHIPKDIKYDSAEVAANSGGAPLASTNIQGSDVSARGLNIYVDSGEIGRGYSYRTEIPMFNYRDIFDIDCSMDKGSNVFPWGKKFEEYEGWSSDNMILAIARATGNWSDYYEFDIPIEIGGQVISHDDIEKILNGLAENYGDDFTQSRRDAVTLALEWVGRGHYSEHHQDHAFLSEICDGPDYDINVDGIAQTMSYDANCTASDDEGFVKFVLNRSGKMDNVNYDIGGWHDYNSGDPLPADILRHDPGNDISSITLDEATVAMVPAVLSSNALKTYIRETFVFYVGKLKNEITLSDGTVIKANETITIDLNPNSKGVGVIRLRTESSGHVFENNDNYTYFWVDNPDVYSKIHYYEYN